MLGAGPGRQPFALGALARAGRGEQQQPHDAASLITVIILLILHGWLEGGYVKAPIPVMARPTISVCMVSVPSKVWIASRSTMCRITW